MAKQNECLPVHTQFWILSFFSRQDLVVNGVDDDHRPSFSLPSSLRTRKSIWKLEEGLLPTDLPSSNDWRNKNRIRTTTMREVSVCRNWCAKAYSLWWGLLFVVGHYSVSNADSVVDRPLSAAAIRSTTTTKTDANQEVVPATWQLSSFIEEQ